MFAPVIHSPEETVVFIQPRFYLLFEVFAVFRITIKLAREEESDPTGRGSVHGYMQVLLTANSSKAHDKRSTLPCFAEFQARQTNSIPNNPRNLHVAMDAASACG